MSDHQHAHFQNLLDLLRQEKEADYRAFLQLVRENPLPERVAQGYTWYPLNVLNTGFSLGEKAFVVVERTTHLNEPHQLRAGQAISLFTQAQHIDEPEKQGVINYVERNRMKIILNARDVPDWLNAGHLGVDMLFDDRSYREMERALERVMAARGDRLAELRRLMAPAPAPPLTPPPGGRGTRSLDTAILPDKKPLHHHTSEIKNLRHPENNNILEGKPPSPRGEGMGVGLNTSQTAAIQAVLENRDVTIIHGPPGTGKTTTLVAAIAQLVETENTVLVTAPSNTAADLLTERLAAQGLNVVRIGNISRVDDSVLEHTVDALLAAHPEAKNIKKVKIEAAEYRRQARRFKRNFDANARRERGHLKQQARELDAWARMLEDRLVDEILKGAQAIVCTLVGAAHPLLDKRTFRTCVIDEAAQALEPACWIPIAKCSRVVLAGDPFQLPPTVKDPDAARKGLSTTLIERCIDSLPDRVYLLTVQYRMHRVIMDFSNQYFYGGALIADDSVAERGLFGAGAEITFIDTAGCGFDERLQESPDALHRNLSRFNPEEALLVREHLLQLLQAFGYPAGDDAPVPELPEIGILSPYREQVNYLEEEFREDALLAPLLAPPLPGKITINTIDGFQGQERDVIYISLVRSNEKHEIGFLQDYRRMNVAMTRARMLLVVIGDSATIGKNPFYQAFLDYVAEHGAYRTAWEFM
ncbi:MAG: AAA family ATPase [Lewinellaceae bacterium]|nr:AAA family ATPase [Saprospiraceae bacterium]MCB9333846.1 AAA family ATPase [Lewinellaceae bacterium]